MLRAGFDEKNPYLFPHFPRQLTQREPRWSYQNDPYNPASRRLPLPSGTAGADWQTFQRGGPMSGGMRDRWSKNFGQFRGVPGERNAPGWEKFMDPSVDVCRNDQYMIPRILMNPPDNWGTRRYHY